MQFKLDSDDFLLPFWRWGESEGFLSFEQSFSVHNCVTVLRRYVELDCGMAKFFFNLAGFEVEVAESAVDVGFRGAVFLPDCEDVVVDGFELRR